MINEATWSKSSSKDEKFNQLWKGINEMKETILIQNGKLDKLTKITQNLENKLNGIKQKIVHFCQIHLALENSVELLDKFHC